MMIDAKKLELIKWLSQLRDIGVILKVDKLRKETVKKKSSQRKFGSGKGIVSYISNDFDEPLDAFKDYRK